MSAVQTQDEQRIERLVAMATRLIEALESDIATLKSGNPRDLRTIDPEIQKLTALYSREAHGFNPKTVANAPPDLRKRLFDATGKFRELLSAQTRLLARLRGATEGMVRAVAEEVDRQRAPMRVYGASAFQAPRASGAMIYNSVV